MLPILIPYRRRAPAVRCLAAALLCLLASGLQAFDFDLTEAPFDYVGDEHDGARWEPGARTAPPMPDAAALLAVTGIGMPPGMTLYLDPAAVEVDPERPLLRYWAVMRAAQGGFNALYVGTRCDEPRHVIYGYGYRPPREPRMNPEPAWQDTPRQGGYAYLRHLRDRVLCSQGRPLPPAEIRGRLDGDGPLPFADLLN